MKLHEFIMEAAGPAIGRKYQHIEDLVFVNGSHGGMHAVERLLHMNSQAGTVETKMDGMPVLYWGRDDTGRFSMMTKNAWDYLKRGKTKLDNGVPTTMRSPDDIVAFITGTGTVAPEDAPRREAYAKQVAALWPYFEAASPKQGFLEGGILFFPGHPPTINQANGTYDFTPNITTFHVPMDSDLGRRVAKAKAMVAATGYYKALGSSEEGRYDGPNLSTPDLVVQGTTYVQEPPNMPTDGLKKIQAYLAANAKAIDSYLGMFPQVGNILYRFYNEAKRSPTTGQQFGQWAQANLSAKQAEKVMSDPKGLEAVLRSVDMITHEKLRLIDILSKGTHGGMRQTKPEGYVQAHPGGKFQHDMPGQFLKTIDQSNWAPRKTA